LIEAKLKEHRIKPITRVVAEDDLDQLGPFDLEFVAVNHSIPDALAVFIRTGAGNILHTGDFKMDQLPLDGRITDLRAFARLAAGRPASWSSRTRRTPTSPAPLPSRRPSGPCSRPSSAPPNAASSSLPSPPTSTASSRCSTPPTPTAARSLSSAGRWCAT